jgi:hypothetical protein
MKYYEKRRARSHKILESRGERCSLATSGTFQLQRKEMEMAVGVRQDLQISRAVRLGEAKCRKLNTQILVPSQFGVAKYSICLDLLSGLRKDRSKKHD